MGLRQAPSFSGSDGKQTVCAVASLSTLGPWGLAGEMVECREMASQADADYRAGGIP